MANVAHSCPDERSAISSTSGLPVLTDGLIPLADGSNDSVISVPLHDDSRVGSGLLCGFTGAATSVSIRSLILPGVVAGLETLLVVDGHRGLAFPDLRPAISRYGRMPQQWSMLIEIAHRVMVARLDRRGAAGLRGWHAPAESDPIITLVLDEVPAIRRMLSSRHLGLVSELITDGGPVGVRVIQIAPSFFGEDIIGGHRYVTCCSRTDG